MAGAKKCRIKENKSLINLGGLSRLRSCSDCRLNWVFILWEIFHGVKVSCLWDEHVEINKCFCLFDDEAECALHVLRMLCEFNHF